VRHSWRLLRLQHLLAITRKPRRLARGETAALAARAVGVTKQTYYRWRKEYGGLQVDQAKRMNAGQPDPSGSRTGCRRQAQPKF